MMAEIYARGPIAATIAVPAALENYTGGIFNDTTGAMGLDHEIEIVGYGSENGVPYWLCRNRCEKHICFDLPFSLIAPHLTALPSSLNPSTAGAPTGARTDGSASSVAPTTLALRPTATGLSGTASCPSTASALSLKRTGDSPQRFAS